MSLNSFYFVRLILISRFFFKDLFLFYKSVRIHLNRLGFLNFSVTFFFFLFFGCSSYNNVFFSYCLYKPLYFSAFLSIQLQHNRSKRVVFSRRNKSCSHKNLQEEDLFSAFIFLCWINCESVLFPWENSN